MIITKQEFREMMNNPNFLINGNMCQINGVKYSIDCDDKNNMVRLEEFK